MEKGLEMVLHAAIVGIVAYVIMLNVLKQPQPMAEDRSILVGAVVLVYMLVFGHNMPSKDVLNQNIFPK